MDDFPRNVTNEAHRAPSGHSRNLQIERFLVYAVALLISAGLMVYAVTWAFVWDEGFHLVAAQLILHGKKPYIDFCFPQTPLNAYWNAAWVRIFGQGWRITHVAASLLLAGTLVLIGHYLLRRLPMSRWRTACILVTLLLFGLNTTVVQFGPIAQAYAMCLFTALAAFSLAIRSVERNSLLLALFAGLFAGAAAASSLLSAPVACVLLLWIWWQNRNTRGIAKATGFVLGAAIPFIPVFWLFAEAPHQTFFNIVQYQALFRRVNWAGATSHDVDVLTSWADSSVTLLLCLLALAGLLYARKLERKSPLRRELYLCGWISLALIAYLSTAHPTFARYYIVVIPFLSVLAAPGLHFAGSRLFSEDNPLWPASSVALLAVLSIFRALFNDRDLATWQRYQEVAAKVASVTPAGAKFFADEQVYFLLRRMPPPGMEFSYSQKLQLPPREEAALHIVSEKELQKQVKAGVFPTLETCNDDRIDDWDLTNLYKRRSDIADCSVFWDYRGLAK
jgi:hypothetical protein